MSTLKARDSNVVIRPIKTEEKTASGLYLPSSSGTEHFRKGIVVDVGPGSYSYGVFTEVENLSEGDSVLYPNEYAASSTTATGEELVVIHASKIQAVIQD